ncbi:MAG: CBS domain-containing protein [Planctomycetia bacterium]|nr:CBS domain-containing protein [Planctomycetia bacterium]
MQVQELMIRPVVVVREHATLEEIAQLMLQRRIGSVPVVDDRGKLCGIVTDSDFMPREYRAPFELKGWAYLFGFQMLRDKIQRIYENSRTRTAAEIMSFPVITATEDAEIDAVVNTMLAYQVHHIPVVRGGVPVGMVARHDLLLMMV